MHSCLIIGERAPARKMHVSAQVASGAECCVKFAADKHIHFSIDDCSFLVLKRANT